jgi:hypothetical protein
MFQDLLSDIFLENKSEELYKQNDTSAGFFVKNSERTLLTYPASV